MKSSLCRIIFILGIWTFCLYSCSEDPAFPNNSLAGHIADLEIPVVYNSLIACAASGNQNLLSNVDNHDISVLFYPEPGAQDFKYFQSEDPLRLEHSALLEISLDHYPVFNGYLRRFLGAGITGAGVVTYVLNDSLYISDVIAIKDNSNPTISNPSGTSIDLTDPIAPVFSWNAAAQGTDVIYFQVVTDESDNLISGTYTLDRNFTFYDLSNVVLNIRDINPPPALEPNTTYKFVMMAVSEDNWVNTLIDTTFTTN